MALPGAISSYPTKKSVEPPLRSSTLMIMEDVGMRVTLPGQGRRTLRSPSGCWRIRPGAFAAAAPWAGHSASDAGKTPKGANNEAEATNERRTSRRIEPPFQTRTGTLSEAGPAKRDNVGLNAPARFHSSAPG